MTIHVSSVSKSSLVKGFVYIPGIWNLNYARARARGPTSTPTSASRGSRTPDAAEHRYRAQLKKLVLSQSWG